MDLMQFLKARMVSIFVNWCMGADTMKNEHGPNAKKLKKWNTHVSKVG